METLHTGRIRHVSRCSDFFSLAHDLMQTKPMQAFQANEIIQKKMVWYSQKWMPDSCVKIELFLESIRHVRIVRHLPN